MMNLGLNDLDSQIQNFLSKLSLGKPESLERSLSDSPTQYSAVPDYDFTQIFLKSRRKTDLRRLAILSWYFPEKVRIILQLSLKEYWDKSDQFCVDKEILLVSKAVALAWILSESNWSESDFFGNILNKKECQRLVDSLDFFRNSKRRVKRYTGYCRGYRESNRRAPRSFPRELERWVLDEEIWDQKVLNYQIKVQSILSRIDKFLEEVV